MLRTIKLPARGDCDPFAKTWKMGDVLTKKLKLFLRKS